MKNHVQKGNRNVFYDGFIKERGVGMHTPFLYAFSIGWKEMVWRWVKEAEDKDNEGNDDERDETGSTIDTKNNTPTKTLRVQSTCSQLSALLFYDPIRP